MSLKGVFVNAEDAVAAAHAAQKEYVTNFTVDDRDRFIAKIKEVFLRDIEQLSAQEYEETHLGRLDDKIIKNTGTIANSPGTECIPKRVYTSHLGISVEYYAPYGIIGAVTPVTNAVATIGANGIAMLASGNAVVFNAHPSAKVAAQMAVDLFNEALVAEGGPLNLVTMVENPTMESLDAIMTAPQVKLLIGTGGPGMVKTLMSSGKKVIAAGAGNPPSIIDDSADIALATETLVRSVSFENNLLCVAEKEIFVVESVYDEFIKGMQNNGARLLTREEADQITAIALHELENNNYIADKKFVGKNANVILNAAGIEQEADLRLAFFEADKSDPFVRTEQMMPILPIVKCKDFAQAKAWAHEAEKGNLHSASIWSENIQHVTEFGRLINTTIFVQNGWTLAGSGLGGAGTGGPTIATPTGEGICDAGTFTRRRRMAIANGGYNLL